MEIISISDIVKRKWIVLKEAKYKNNHGKILSWEYVERTNNPKIVTVIVKSLKSDKYLFIEQFRVSVQDRVLEFPAGLVDENEFVDQAAIRELREETGYSQVNIEYKTSFTPKTAGLTNEMASIVYCTIESEELKGSTEMDDSEDITYFWFSPEEFFHYIENNKVLVANDVISFMLHFKLNK